jgi:hypothetical protein
MILEKPESSTFSDQWKHVCRLAEAENPWFTQSQIFTAVEGICTILEANHLHQFAKKYVVAPHPKQHEIGVIMAGNIPAAGFHDMLCVSLSGNQLSAKLSSSDKTLLPFLQQLLKSIDAELSNKIKFVDNLKNVDAVIATGSDNSARYFEYYFASKPHIFRKNRNSIAILTGQENEFDLILLGKDIFTYFGLGCRSISKLYVPEGYSFDMFYEAMLEFKDVMQHSRYMNNHDYHQALFLLNQEPFLTNNFLILKEDARLSSPVGVLFYEYYSNIDDAIKKTVSLTEKTQCVVMKGGSIALGRAQFPLINEFADGVDTMQFLTSL